MPAFKKIKDYTQDELKRAIENAVEHCQWIEIKTTHGLEGSIIHAQLDFWKILNGVDAYMERRRRKEEAEATKELENFGIKTKG